MISPNEFVKTFGNPSGGVSVQFATVDPAYSSGKPKLTFDGETSVSQKGYPYLKGYTPMGGERVLVLNGVVIDGIAQ